MPSFKKYCRKATHQAGKKKKMCARRKKVIRIKGKPGRYYRAGPKTGLVKLKGNQKPPRIRR